MDAGHMTIPTPHHFSGISQGDQMKTNHVGNAMAPLCQNDNDSANDVIWLDCCVSNATNLNQQSNNFFIT